MVTVVFHSNVYLEEDKANRRAHQSGGSHHHRTSAADDTADQGSTGL